MLNKQSLITTNQLIVRTSLCFTAGFEVFQNIPKGLFLVQLQREVYNRANQKDQFLIDSNSTQQAAYHTFVFDFWEYLNEYIEK